MRHYKHLSDSERKVIQNNIWESKNITEIAKATGRDKRTISRELKRNKTQKEDKLYRACEAHEKYKKRINSKKDHIQHKIDAHYDLFLYVLEKILKKWAPDVIAGRLKIEFPNDKRYHISHESIYQWIYMKSKEYGIKFYKLLPYGHKIRYRRRYKRGRRTNIPDRVSIHSRPSEVESRESFGHWEADPIIGKGAKSNVINTVERVTRFIMPGKMEGKTSEACNKSLLEAVGEIPNKFFKTMTVDNGPEWTEHKSLAEALECNIYFADPYASYQKGAVEHANMLLRRRFPKGTDFSKVTEKELQREADKINNIPRKVINYLTPKELFEILSVALKS